MFSKKSDDMIAGWIRSDDLNRLGSYLVSGSVHGKPGVPAAELARVEKIIRKELSAPQLYALAKKLLKRPEYTSRNIGCHLLVFGPGQKDIGKYLRLAANDPDWIVREFAAGGFAALLAHDFKKFSSLFSEWTREKTMGDEQVNVKRAVALAVKYDSKTADLKKWKTYLRLIDPLMAEEAGYIKKNLGPFAIGDGLLSRFPEEVLAACEDWRGSANEHVRWNTAMIFSAAAARKFRVKGMRILKGLEKDETKAVARAVARAMKNLQKS